MKNLIIPKKVPKKVMKRTLMKILFVQMMNPFPPQNVIEKNTTRWLSTIVNQRTHDDVNIFLDFPHSFLRRLPILMKRLLLSVKNST